VPVEVTVRLLVNAIKADGGSRFLVDGFPRNTNNLAGWQHVVGDSLALGGVLFYDCPEERMEERLLERGKTSGRTDDNAESIRKRFRTYQNETTPIIAYYDYQSLVHKIDGAREIDAVWADTASALSTIEARLQAANIGSVCAHLYAVDGVAPPAEALVAKFAAAAEERFGGKVGVSGSAMIVDRSLKAFDLDATPAFD